MENYEDIMHGVFIFQKVVVEAMSLMKILNRYA